jgi:aryl-alcohol dehydrogenase-like predicted oxidoreductase
MEYQQLGTSGVRVSVLALGCWRFGEATGPEGAAKIIHRALDAGINFLDTANMYQNGLSETILGSIITPIMRENIVLASKCHFPMGDGVNDYGNSRRHIMQQVEQSLKRLKTDHLDLYYLHRPDPTTPPEEELRALEDLMRQGKILYAGSSHYAAWQLCKSKWVADVRNLSGFVVEQAGFSLIRNEAEKELFPCASDLKVGIVAHSPLAQGVLTGKYHQEKIPSDARGVVRDGEIARKAASSHAVIDCLRSVAKDVERTMEQVAIRWVLQKKPVCATVIGPRTIEQLESNLSSVGWSLAESQMQRLNAVAIQL